MGSRFIFTCIPSPNDFSRIIYSCSLCTRYENIIITTFESTFDFFILFQFGVGVFLGGQAILLMFVNCIVHAIMYTYYLLSICKTMRFKPSITMKKNVTRLQIVSFVQIQILIIPSCICSRSCFYSQFVFRFNFAFWSYILDMVLWFPVKIVAIPKFYPFCVSNNLYLWWFYLRIFIGVHMGRKGNNRKFNDAWIGSI